MKKYIRERMGEVALESMSEEDRDTLEVDVSNEMFIEVLEAFIDRCGLDQIDICKKAQELLDLINE